jgi:subfamily B ATP-binding cassette protein MsbA
MADLTQILGEGVDCQKVIKVYGGEEYEESRFNEAAQAIRRNGVKQSAASSANTGVTQLMIACALAAILYFAALRAQHGSFTAGDFMSFLTAMMLLFAPVKRITGISQAMQRGLAAAQSVFTFLDEPGEPDHGTRRLPQTQGRLRFDNVSFRYPNAERDVLQQVSLEVNSGETVALVGSSGSGKTTLVSLIPRFYQPLSGQITLDGIALDDIVLADLRQHIAMVSQDVVLFNDTVAANIAYGHARTLVASRSSKRHARRMRWSSLRRCRKARHQMGENGVRLSGGQRQRLAIAAHC